MQVWTVVIGAAGGACVGALGGFGTALLALAARRRRNRALMDRGQPAIRDEALLPLSLPAALVGAIAGGVGSAWIALPGALALSFLAFPAIYGVLAAVASLSDRGTG